MKREGGYAMAVLLAGIAAMGVMLTVAMPVWRQAMQREKEEELIFRGNQYARAVGLYQRRNGPGAYPPSLDLLVQQRYLRKKYKDPVAKDGDFQLIPAGAMQPGQVGPTMPPGSGTRTQQLASQLQSQFGASRTGMQSPSGTFQTVVTAIAGVVSKSTAKSIKIYNGRDHYNEWFFVYSSQGVGGAGVGVGGRGRGGRGGPDGRGRGGRGDTQFGPGDFPDRGGGRGRGRGGFGPGGPGGDFNPTQLPPRQGPPGGGRGRGGD